MAFKSASAAGADFAQLAGTDWLLTARDKARVALRAFEMLRVNVRPLFGRNIVAQ